jgi:hypothetical protein
VELRARLNRLDDAVLKALHVHSAEMDSVPAERDEPVRGGHPPKVMSISAVEGWDGAASTNFARPAGAGEAADQRGSTRPRWIVKADRLITTMSIVMCIFAVAVVASTLVPGAPLLPEDVFLIPLLAVVPSFGWAAISSAFLPRARGPSGLERLLDRLTDPQQELSLGRLLKAVRGLSWRRATTTTAIAVVLAGLAYSGIVTTGSLEGQPEVHNGRYFSGQHGSLIPLTRKQYERQVVLEQQSGAAWAAVFLLVSAGVTSGFVALGHD